MLCDACERLANATSACGSGSRVASRVSAQLPKLDALVVDRDLRLDRFARSHRREELIERRRIDDAEDRLAIDDEPDVDREFRTALDEGARSVEWIDEKERIPRGRHASGRHRLLGDHRNPRCGAMQAFGQHLFGLMVGDGDRRRVGLRLHFDAGREVAHLDAPGREHGGKQRLDQRTVFL